METNSSSTNLLSRSKKLPPPPLCLPATNPVTDDEHISNLNSQRERKRSTNNCCLTSSSTEDCSHKTIPYVLPTSQRPQILETLIASSSVLLAPPLSETKQKKSYTAAYANQINLLKQRQSSSKVTVSDAEWTDFMRLILNKSLERDLISLLDKYKTTYFDRVNAPNTTDDTIRSSLCAMVNEALTTYAPTSSFPSTTMAAVDELTTNISSPIPPTTITNNGSAKRKRKTTSNSLSVSAPISINTQTKFVISSIIPGKYETNNSNGNKTTSQLQQQQQKQFQKKYSHLFKYIPDKEVQSYLIREDLFKTNSSFSPSSNNNICLMLYDEVSIHMDQYDLELSGISPDDAFTLPEPIVIHITNSI